MKRLLLLTSLVLWIGNLQAQISKVNVTIDGPGVVDEYLSLDADGKKQLKLKAVPSKFLGDVSFDGWSGDATGTSEELIVSPDKAQNIHATFTYHRPTKKYSLLNLKQSWADMGKPLYYEMPPIWETQDMTAWRGTNYLPVDYNRDGYIDYVQFPKLGGMGTDNHRENVRFWLGNPDGSFEEDPKNDDRILGTVYSIIIKYADFNNDGYPDLCSFSSGYDRGGSTGDYPVVLMSGSDGVYTDLRYTDYNNGYFHGGTTGDFDNDGDIDALFWDMWHNDGENSLYLENDGMGHLIPRDAREIIDLSAYLNTLPSAKSFNLLCDIEMTDLNNDGYNDLIICGHDHQDKEYGYPNTPIVLWGSSTGKFGGTNYTLLPKPRLGYGISTSICFYDFNGDGVKEIIIDKNGDGVFGNSRFYVGGYLQVCELVNGQYVDKTDQYIPIEHQAFNKEQSECRMTIENIDGTDCLVTYQIEGILQQGVGTGCCIPYAIRNGVMESLEGEFKTKISSFDEGLPFYVDGPQLTDLHYVHDGLNPVDTMAEHHWVDYSDWDAPGGNMWRINFAHRKDTHFGRTCIRWNRDGQDPNKDLQEQMLNFGFISDVNLQELYNKGYYLEFYIKNSDQDLTFNIAFESEKDLENPQEYYHPYSATMSKKYVEGGQFSGEWQRVLIPLSAFSGDVEFKKSSIAFRIDKGDINNVFYIDDIRIRRLADSGMDDYDRAFLMDYLNKFYFEKERTAQVQSQEFKAMLKPLISKFAPDSMKYFNKYITDYEVPLTRAMATCMAYYTARCIGAESNNAITGEQPADIWECDFKNFDNLLPHWGDPGEEDAPEDMFWRSTGFGGWMTCFFWNFWHASDKSGINVIGLDKDANSFHWNDPLTWEDAIRAITRLYDSTDRKPAIILGDANGDGLVNVTDIVATVNFIMEKPSDGFNKEAADLNGDGVVNVTDIVMMVKIIMEASAREMEE